VQLTMLTSINSLPSLGNKSDNDMREDADVLSERRMKLGVIDCALLNALSN
jgi:hypothetical protein